MQGDRDRCLAAGMNGHLSKPIDAAQLFETLETFAASNRVHDIEPEKRGLQTEPQP
jgi:CheY-like chemotaxis protein